MLAQKFGNEVRCPATMDYIVFVVSGGGCLLGPSCRGQNRTQGEQSQCSRIHRTSSYFRVSPEQYVTLNYFCRRNLRSISGQNSLTMLLRLAASSCDTQFTAVLSKPRSLGG